MYEVLTLLANLGRYYLNNIEVSNKDFDINLITAEINEGFFA